MLKAPVSAWIDNTFVFHATCVDLVCVFRQCGSLLPNSFRESTSKCRRPAVIFKLAQDVDERKVVQETSEELGFARELANATGRVSYHLTGNPEGNEIPPTTFVDAETKKILEVR
jgi:hypothetical protein